MVGLGLCGEVERRPSPYRTSFPIEQVQVELAGEGPVTLAFKDLDWRRLEAEARLAKPGFLHDPRREPAVYRGVLSGEPGGPPRYYGSVDEADRHWLFVEWVEGRELFQVGERELWEEAARWLARFHVATGPELDRHRREARLIEHDATFYRGWVVRAKRFAEERADRPVAAVAHLARGHDLVVEALRALPRSVVHGEFYASNVLVASASTSGSGLPQERAATRVAPVDWELAAAGAGLTDLAALVSGWPAADREALVAAYAGEPGVPSFTLRDLAFARLQVAVQWLGWAPPRWRPPPGRRHDWLAEAVELAEELDL
jgi:aminoglycoside phosphotransferase (APT) family kinase protein